MLGGGAGLGSQAPQHTLPQNEPLVALVVLNTHMWGFTLWGGRIPAARLGGGGLDGGGQGSGKDSMFCIRFGTPLKIPSTLSTHAWGRNEIVPSP